MISLIFISLVVIFAVNYHINRLLKSMVTAKIPISFDSIKDWFIGIAMNPNLRAINILMFLFCLVLLICYNSK